MKKLALLALLLAIAAGLAAQPGVRPVKVFGAYDIDSLVYVYCVPAVPVPFVACDTGGTGVGADDGWIGVRGMSEKEVIIRVDAIVLTAGSIDFTIEGRWLDSSGTRATATLIAPISKTAVAAGQPVRIPENIEEIRVGVRINGTDDA
ncbi:MAG: hypothetical protein ACREIS_12700, partial [Nitrospiraceae bacterium]